METKHIEQFIKDAIAGGWRNGNTFEHLKEEPNQWLFQIEPWNFTVLTTEEILLDPEAWKAVGKTRGWNEEDPEVDRVCVWEGNCWKVELHRFIDHLADGHSIDIALSNLD